MSAEDPKSAEEPKSTGEPDSTRSENADTTEPPDAAAQSTESTTASTGPDGNHVDRGHRPRRGRRARHARSADDTTGAAATQTDPDERVSADAHDNKATGDTDEQPWFRRELTRYFRHFSFFGVVLGLVLLWASTTPSLLPRGPLFQGLVSGGSFAIGYMVGAFLSWLVKFMTSRDSLPRPHRVLWWIVGVVAVVGSVLAFYWFQRWQNEIRDLMGMSHLPWTAYPIAVAVAIVVAIVLVIIGQLWGALVRWLSRVLGRFITGRIAAVIGFAVVVAVTISVLNGVVAREGMSALNNAFAAANDETRPNSVRPTSELRSGGPGSLVSWSSLGREGRIVVSNGPSVQQLSEFNGSPAMEPIRVYAGLDSSPSQSFRANAALAADELVRTGGLRRKIVAIGSATGSGWLNQATMSSLEYMYNGDTAIVSMQYSYLPSWLSFVVDKERTRQAGTALFEAVDARIRALPEGERPKLVVFGESLGSFGGEAPFGNINNVVARTDGALFSGPTFQNQIWADLRGQRDKGSPEWLPIYDQGNSVRFVSRPDDLDRPAKPWSTPRVIYLQHASDPIAWWSPSLLFRQPDWLKEKRGPDVLSSTHWIPVVTFLQVAADMAVSDQVPDGHGHFYLKDIANCWAAILQPPGWTQAKTEALRPLLRRSA